MKTRQELFLDIAELLGKPLDQIKWIKKLRHPELKGLEKALSERLKYLYSMENKSEELN